MKSFQTGFSTELAKKTGITPIWILKLTVDGIIYYLSDAVFTGIPSFGSTLAWVKSWGDVRESISGSIGEMLIADFSVSLLADQDLGENIYHLALGHPLEKSPAELYLWLKGVATPPELMFRGFVKDINIPDETSVDLTIEDESTRYQKYVGTRISSESFPLCDPEVVGKMIPIVYGTVEKLPVLCVDSGFVTSTMYDINATETIVQVSEIPSSPILNKLITIDDETLQILNGGVLGPRENKALSGKGAAASATTSNPSFPPTNAIDGNRIYNSPTLSSWCSATGSVAAQTFTVRFVSAVNVDEVNLIFIQDNLNPSVAPVADVTVGTLYLHADFTIEVEISGAWVNYATVTGNNKVFRHWTTTKSGVTAARVVFPSKRADGVNHAIAEFEVWGSTPNATPKVLTVTRGVNNTVAAIHTKGSTVIEKKSTPLVYTVADHALDAMTTVMARVRGVNVDITADVTPYLNTTDSEATALGNNSQYKGRALLTIPDFAKVYQRIALAIDDQLKINDANHTHNTGATTSNVTVACLTALPASGTAYPGTIPGNTGAFYMSMVAVRFPTGSYNSATLNLTITSGCIGWGVLLSNDLVLDAWSKTAIVYTWNPKVTGYAITIPLTGTQMTYQYVHLVCRIENTSSYPTSFPSGVGPGYIGAASISANVNQGGVGTTGSPSYVGRAGAITLTGNSVADIMIGDLLTVTATRNISAPAAVLDHFLKTYCGETATLTTVGTFPAVYSLNGAITEYKRAIEWIDALAFQVRAYFRKTAGVPKIVFREINPTPVGTIPACCLTSEGIRDLSFKKASTSDVVNRVKVFFKRDWTKTSRGSESYDQATASQTDPTSIAIYGEQERPEMFMLDFVTNISHANDLATAYVDFYGDRKWRVSFSTFLDQAAFEFGDVVNIPFLPFLGELNAQIVDAGVSPGDLNNMDRMKFIVETTIIPVLDDFALVTLTGDALMTKEDRVGLVYK